MREPRGSSWAAARGASLQVIGKALGRADVSTTAIYSRLNLDLVRAVVEATVQTMLGAGNGSKKMLPAPKKVKATAKGS